MTGSKIRLAILSLTALVAMAACSSNQVSVTTDYQPVDFSVLQTYQWLPTEEMGNQAPDLDDARIRKAIDSTLAEKNFQIVAEDPDFYVGYSVLAQPHYDVNQYQVYEGYAPGFTWGRDYGMVMTDTVVGHTETVVDEYVEGTLFIDILNTSKEIIWRGTASDRLPENIDRQRIDSRVKEVTASILESFPPPSDNQ